MRRLFSAAVIVVVLVSAGLAQNLTPTTTLTLETSNNTSTANTYFDQQNGNAGARNVSKVPTRTLLYPGSTTKLIAHVEPWWGKGSHIDIGYSSQDPGQVHRQVMDMISRGLDGLAVDWYGPDSYEDLGVKLLLSEAEQHPGFTVFVEIDHGAVQWDSCYPGCSATTAFIQLATRVSSSFFSSPAYLKIGGRPVLREFGMELHGPIDWNAIQAQVPGNPLILHRNANGFAVASSGGAFGWMEPKTLDNLPSGYDGTDEVDWFYSQASSKYSGMAAFGAAFKGFNDIMADWAPPGGRHIEQLCGQTWLRTFESINQVYSVTRQLTAVQLVTWNDYEEGTEVESGIDNCVSVSGAISGTKLTWSITGQENTLDHYTVFISKDGENLASLGDFGTGTHSLDFAAFNIPAGTYTLYVKAVGKPTLRNQMSGPIAYTVAAPPAPTSSGGGTSSGGSGSSSAATTQTLKDLTLSASPSAATVTRGQTGKYTLSVTEVGASDPVALSCSNVPAEVTCTFSPATVTPSGTTPASVTLTVGTMTTAAHKGSGSGPMYAMWLGGFGVAGMFTLPGAVRRNRRLWLLMIALGLACVSVACGGGSTTSKATALSGSASSYSITVNATSGAVAKSTTVTLHVQ